MSLTYLKSETAFAKINLALHVRRRRSDGYHELESVFAFADRGDTVYAEPDNDLALSIEGPFRAQLDCGSDNLVMRAAKAVKEQYGIRKGARLRLDKNLPVASGVGGGSADAAATIRLLCQLWEIDRYDAKILEIAKKLGADVPACLLSSMQYGQGRGDELEVLDDQSLSGTALLLANPMRPLSTADVFARWDGIDRGPIDRNQLLANRNDLTSAAITLMPVIGSLIQDMRKLPGVILARMSGSGATCFALFNDAETCEAGKRQMEVVQPGLWTMTACLR